MDKDQEMEIINYDNDLECTYCGTFLKHPDELGLYRNKYLNYKNQNFCDEECLTEYITAKAMKQTQWITL